MNRFYSNGKLLITGEYAVLDGALALAIPTRYGQSLEITPSSENVLAWKSLDYQDQNWFEARFTLSSFQVVNTTNPSVADTLQGLLKAAREQNPDFLSGEEGYIATSTLYFPNNWGLGSSSTLINNLAQWARVDAYALLWKAFGGSGYDIACAQHNTPICYRKKQPKPEVSEVDFTPSFADRLFFVHLNQKQNSKAAIANYSQKKIDKEKLIDSVNAITTGLLHSETIETFSELLESHERLLAEILETPTVKQRLFPDYPYTLKSLGAWGGDFILAVGNENSKNYFQKKGFRMVIPFKDMILNSQ
ncbi:MAG: GYDIA family GHMP kinase [Bacteroidota bacterium]